MADWPMGRAFWSAATEWRSNRRSAPGRSFWKSALGGLLILGSLGSLLLLLPTIRDVWGERSQRFVDRALAPARPIDEAALPLGELVENGYYEVLLNKGKTVASARGLPFGQGPPDGAANGGEKQPSVRRMVPGFVIFDYEPNRILEHTDLRVNSFGMADKEYTLAKPPQTRRIAVLGDSMTRGWGAAFGNGWEALLETRLNEDHRDGAVKGYELLNFAVDGYSLTQVVDVALEKTPAFEPDVYVLVLSPRAASKTNWGLHFAALVQRGLPLKYEFLRRTAGEARLYPEARIPVYQARLEKYRLPGIQWVLAEIKALGARSGAPVIVLLLGNPWGPWGASASEDHFAGVPELLEELDIPTVDLRDVLAGRDDLEDLRFKNPYIKDDFHPNDQGYRVLFEQLYRKLQEDPRVLALLLTGGS